MFDFVSSDLLSVFDTYLLFVDPWMHGLCTGGGAWVAKKWIKLEMNLMEDINELRAYKGLPPMVGSHNYFPFNPPKFEEKK